LGLVVLRQKLTRPLLETIAQTIATFHRGAEIRIDKGGYGGLSFICGNNAECFERFAEGIFDPRLITELNQKTRAQVERLRDLLEQRREQGYVRQCHGDMHLRNIFLEDGKPVLFDGIEFNDDIACIDTLYDLAFLLMDLDERELHREANILFNRYMDIIGDVSGLAALPLMLSLRAAIRAHVGAAALHNSGKLKDDALVEPRLYLDNALRHLDRPPPRLIAIGGLSGSGKSRLAREIAPLVYAPPGALVLRSDAIRKRLSGASMLERLGPEGYTPEKSVQTYETLYNDAQRALEAGHTVIADAVFSKPEERTAIEAVAQKSGLPFNGLWVSASPEIMAERIAKRKGNVSDATVEVLQQQLNYDLGTVSWNKVDSSGPGKATVTSAMTILRS
jgi:predicted kinase